MKRIVFAVAAVILVAGLAFGVYDTYQKRELRSRVVEIVVAAAGQLEETLGVDVKSPVAGLAERLDASVARADAGLQQLRALKARRDPELVAAADPFVSGEGVTSGAAGFGFDRGMTIPPSSRRVVPNCVENR